MKRPPDPVNQPGRFVEEQIIAGITIALWCKPLGRGGDASWTAVLDPAGPQPQAFTRATRPGAIAAALAARRKPCSSCPPASTTPPPPAWQQPSANTP